MSTTEEKKPVSARVSAEVVSALAPMIKEVQEFAHSEFAFYNQMPTRRFGAYLIPQEKGVLVAVCDMYRMFAVHDPEGFTREPVQVYFPDGLLDAAQPQTVTLADENGSPFAVTRQPRPHMLLISEGFCILFPDDTEKWGGSFGTWFNGDHGNVIDRSTFRAEPADVSFLGVPKRAEPKSTDFNPALLKSIFAAADALGRLVTLDYGTGVLEIIGDGLCGYVMPCVRKEPAPASIKDALLSLANPQ